MSMLIISLLSKHVKMRIIWLYYLEDTTTSSVSLTSGVKRPEEGWSEGYIWAPKEESVPKSPVGHLSLETSQSQSSQNNRGKVCSDGCGLGSFLLKSDDWCATDKEPTLRSPAESTWSYWNRPQSAVGCISSGWNLAWGQSLGEYCHFSSKQPWNSVLPSPKPANCEERVSKGWVLVCRGAGMGKTLALKKAGKRQLLLQKVVAASTAAQCDVYSPENEATLIIHAFMELISLGYWLQSIYGTLITGYIYIICIQLR